MEVIKFGSSNDTQITLLLGYFDCLHKGHRQLIKEAENFNNKTAIFTFSDKYYLKDDKVVFSFNERLELFKKAGIDFVIVADFDENFKNMSSELFLSSLIEKYNINAVVCGYDYKFGKAVSGNISTLKKFCTENNIICKITEKVEFEGEKASSSIVKKLLKQGNIKKANSLLSGDYFISGRVETGRKVGSTLGFPTANIHFNSHKAEIKEGVYKVYSYISDKKYIGLCNYGSKPTFDISEKTIEVFFKNYNGDLYGQEITVYFTDFIRNVMKFENIEKLKIQLKRDLELLND